MNRGDAEARRGQGGRQAAELNHGGHGEPGEDKAKRSRQQTVGSQARRN